MSEKGDFIQEKCMNFSIRIVKMYKYLCSEKQEYILSKQLLRSGTSIGANIAEAQNAISKKDFVAKVYIALKECTESKYWIELLYRTEYLTTETYSSIKTDCEELEKLLTTTTKKLANCNL